MKTKDINLESSSVAASSEKMEAFLLPPETMAAELWEQQFPMAESGIKAGFPSPAQDYMTDGIDFNRELVHHRETTFCARVSGSSMDQAGIFDGDIVVIDKSLEARNGDVVAAYVDGGFTLKEFRLDADGKSAWLIPANDEYQPIHVTEENNFIVWGVLTYTIHKLR